jgi:hypothetical protein
MTVVSFFLGVLLGGLVGVGLMCCLQINKEQKQNKK